MQGPDRQSCLLLSCKTSIPCPGIHDAHGKQVGTKKRGQAIVAGDRPELPSQKVLQQQEELGADVGAFLNCQPGYLKVKARKGCSITKAGTGIQRVHYVKVFH